MSVSNNSHPSIGNDGDSFRRSDGRENNPHPSELDTIFVSMVHTAVKLKDWNTKIIVMDANAGKTLSSKENRDRSTHQKY